MTPESASRTSFFDSGPLVIASHRIEAGTRRSFEIPIARLPTQGLLGLPLTVLRGPEPGPCVWLSAAIHGDELCGVEIIRRLLSELDCHQLRGTLIAAPIVNIFGFLHQKRELPDGRDLNRSFPGSARGSLAARLAHIFLTEVAAHGEVGIDFHSATQHRTNWPQIRANLDDPRTRELALAFNAPVTVAARLRDGSLRATLAARSRPVLVFEGGESQRFEEDVILCGLAGTRRVLAAVGLTKSIEASPKDTIEVQSTRWVRARRAGIVRLRVQLGQRVRKNDIIATLGEAFGPGTPVKSTLTGIVIGLNKNPVAHQGTAIIHIGRQTEDLSNRETQPPDTAAPKKRKKTTKKTKKRRKLKAPPSDALDTEAHIQPTDH